MTDDLSLQADEVQAISCIYQDEWRVLSEAERRYSVLLGSPPHCITLQVTLPTNYPSISSPHYELCEAGWLRGNSRSELRRQLDLMWQQNVGSCVLHLWIECVRDFVKERAMQETPSSSAATLTEGGAGVVMTPPTRVFNIVHGDCITDRKSVFQAHCAQINSVQDCSIFLQQLLTCRKVATATHNSWAYRVSDCGSNKHDCDDDGETHAGSRLLHLLTVLHVQDVMVVVSRWFGGVLLGADRFRHINNAARSALHHAQLLPQQHHKHNEATMKQQ